jgi:hypothetical protein
MQKADDSSAFFFPLPNPHRLGIHEFVYAQSRQLAAVTGRLDAAKRQAWIGDRTIDEVHPA